MDLTEIIECFIKNLKTTETHKLRSMTNQAAAGITVPVFYELLPGSIIGSKIEEVFVFIARLFSINNLTVDTGNFGETLAQLKIHRSTKTFDTDVSYLFSIRLRRVWGKYNYTELFHHLSRFISMAKNNDIGVNYQRLLSDILNWAYQSKGVQRSWAISYYRGYCPKK